MLLLQHADVSLFLLEYDDISLLWRHCELVEHRIFSKKGGVMLDMILGANNEGQTQMLSQHGTRPPRPGILL